MSAAATHAQEIAAGQRFEFGKNWSRFLRLLTGERIAAAEASLREMLAVDSLEGTSFLDIGCGSGLFSLAARRLGARVHSLDFDPHSVACAAELRRRYFPGDPEWRVETGSALDADYLRSLGQFDVVYSWGVLHHTGKMWEACANAVIPVADCGKLFIAIYNDTGREVARWQWIKRNYCRLPRALKAPYTVAAMAPYEAKFFLRSLFDREPKKYLHSWTRYTALRGMSRWRDMVDWVGGYPYEVATPDEIEAFYAERGFSLLRANVDGVGLGCNEFVLVRNAEGS